MSGDEAATTASIFTITIALMLLDGSVIEDVLSSIIKRMNFSVALGNMVTGTTLCICLRRQMNRIGSRNFNFFVSCTSHGGFSFKILQELRMRWRAVLPWRSMANRLRAQSSLSYGHMLISF